MAQKPKGELLIMTIGEIFGYMKNFQTYAPGSIKIENKCVIKDHITLFGQDGNFYVISPPYYDILFNFGLPAPVVRYSNYNDFQLSDFESLSKDSTSIPYDQHLEPSVRPMMINKELLDKHTTIYTEVSSNIRKTKVGNNTWFFYCVFYDALLDAGHWIPAYNYCNYSNSAIRTYSDIWRVGNKYLHIVESPIYDRNGKQLCHNLYGDTS